MLDIFDAFATDEKKELEGAWEPIGSGTELLIARAENDNNLRQSLALLEANQEQLDTLPEDEKRALDRELTLGLMADTILLGWKSLVYKGKTLKYSRDNAIMLLRHADFRKQVMRLANKRSRYQLVADEADTKN